MKCYINTFTNCLDHIFIDNPNGYFTAPSNLQITCNKFITTENNARGIIVGPNSFITNIGTASTPAGNLFDGVAEPIRMDNTNPASTWTYFSCSDENASISGFGTIPFSVANYVILYPTSYTLNSINCD